jgi:hypothetical protein
MRGDDKMDKIKKTDTTTPGPVDLDSEQLEELDKLINMLKKEIIYPDLKTGGKSEPSKTGLA